jgi:hypothetical protein
MSKGSISKKVNPTPGKCIRNNGEEEEEEEMEKQNTQKERDRKMYR